MRHWKSHTNPVRDICKALNISEGIGFHIAWFWRKYCSRDSIKRRQIPSGTFDGRDPWSRWTRVPSGTRAAFYEQLNDLYDDMLIRAAEERKAKGYDNSHRW